MISFVIDTEGIDLIDPKLIAALPMPVTFAINPYSPSAEAVLRSLRAMKQEAVILADLSKGGSAEDIGSAVSGLMNTFPEVVGIMDSSGGRSINSQEAMLNIAKVLEIAGHGILVHQTSTDNIAKEFIKNGIPAVKVRRDLDDADQSEVTIRSYLDNIVFNAGNSTSENAVVFARLRPTTMSALLIWDLQDNSRNIAIVPLSQQLQAVAKKIPKGFSE